jgi:hypothetical protein
MVIIADELTGESLGWRGGLLGGALGYVIGLFFKSSIVALITLKFPSIYQYLVNTFIPSSAVDFIRFFTVPVPFALLGAALGAVYLNQAREKVGKVGGPAP